MEKPRVIKNDTTSFYGKDIYPIYIYSASKLLYVERYKSDNALTRYEIACKVHIDNLLRKKSRDFIYYSICQNYGATTL